ncbi:hypothetical protein F4553_001070 [Allocatelliglobosispora scoriae]|uniref:DUF2795 domain-containing protein n=1 Tax=Allocatelliglobosispora scoriae TaxID=643052 RepID=A0A841BLF1_9ACTN|nr:DUF2795 domain-containing protein [Allocatelliglobosispora scoriae]MBB5867691.1 hypothetical protein [Allocatelliglobosispora scoriae]
MTTDAQPTATHTDPQLNAGFFDEDAVPAENTVGRDGVIDEHETDPERRELRAEIGKYVSLATFPATSLTLIESATANRAPDEVLDELRALPEDRSFETARDLWLELGLEVAERF